MALLGRSIGGHGAIRLVAELQRVGNTQTSLIAAARSLLRPREIMPGDPVLRVRVDPSDRAVTALFPFGLVKLVAGIKAKVLAAHRAGITRVSLSRTRSSGSSRSVSSLSRET